MDAGVGTLPGVGNETRESTTPGSTTVRLSVMPGNGAARALYRRCGFAETGEPGGLLADGVTREVVMELALPR